MSSSLNDRYGFTRRYVYYLVAGWTFIIIVSLFWSIQHTHDTTLEKARAEARTLYEINLAYRTWAAGHGGVYVPVTDTLKPNPYLITPDRDITANNGKKLTLVNPAWMTRQVFEILKNQSSEPVLNHIVSLKYLNPRNKPDEWEERSLRAFEKGSPEASEMLFIDNQPYIRLIRPFITQEACLKCHKHQGYKVGDIRGGISISIPMNPHLQTEANEKKSLVIIHAVFWIIGMGGIFLFARTIQRNQRQITESEEKYRLLFENNPYPMWVYDLETYRFLTVNDFAVHQYGYSKEEFLSMTIKDIRFPEDATALTAHVSSTPESEDHAGVWRHKKKDGTVFFAEITAHIMDFAGRRAKLVMAHDVSERKRLEEQLRHSQKMEAVGLLAGGVAHDFNNILTAIIGYNSLLKINLEGDERLLRFVNEVTASAERGSNLTHSLLAFGRKQLIKPHPLNINQVVRQVATLLQRLIGEDIRLEIKLCDDDVTVIADSGQMEQVLMNLATNARDSMPEGGRFTIETGRETLEENFAAIHDYGKAGHYAVISLSDTGRGMDAAIAERIFEPFFTTKEMGRGTGLGLSIVYGIVKQHGGYINVATEPGKGTRFKIYLPQTDRKPQKTGVPRPDGALELIRGAETILVAEDDAPVRELVKSVLEKFGYRVLDAADGEDALAKIREHRQSIQLLLLDVIMPKKNGKEVYEQAKKIIPGIRVLFASGYTADIVHKQGILDEELNFISKPVAPNELLRKVREVLDEKRAGQPEK